MLQHATQGFQNQGLIIHDQDQGPLQGIRPVQPRRGPLRDGWLSPGQIDRKQGTPPRSRGDMDMTAEQAGQAGGNCQTQTQSLPPVLAWIRG